MLKTDIKKLPSTVKEAPSQPHPFWSLESPNSYFKAAAWDFTALDKGVLFFSSQCDCVELSTEPNTWNTEIITVSQASPRDFLLGWWQRCSFNSFSEEQQPMPREDSKHISGSPKCQVLPRACIVFLKPCWKRSPEKQSPSSTSWSSPSQGRAVSAPLL